MPAPFRYERAWRFHRPIDAVWAAIADEVESRPYNPVIRLEVEAGMPREVRAYLLRAIRAEQPTEDEIEVHEPRMYYNPGTAVMNAQWLCGAG